MEATIRNGGWLPLQDVPLSAPEHFRRDVVAATRAGARLLAFFAMPVRDGRRRLLAVLATGTTGTIAITGTEVAGSYPALTPECPQAHLFEREIHETTAIQPLGHSWLKPVRMRPPDDWGEDGFFHMEGREVHEVAVGPVHAGVIEPGHFRFQCEGERVHHLEIALGYQYRGVERALAGGPDKRTVHLLETAAGDTSVGHATAYAQIVEGLGNGTAPERGHAVRAIALELERLANHAGDLGALAGDVGYLPTASFCGRLRGEILGLTALACGSRLGRGWVRPGGVAFDLDPERAAEIGERLARALPELLGAVDLLRNTSTVRARFEETGRLSAETCGELGIVGVPARAAGLARDARSEFPLGAYTRRPIEVATWDSGDVFGRARVRWMEIERSIAFIAGVLPLLPPGPTRAEPGPLAREAIAVSIVEGWRGEIGHVAVTDEAGRFSVYKVVDPSFKNWIGLAMAMRGQAISDFPLCNKSFNLSYCGHDL